MAALIPRPPSPPVESLIHRIRDQKVLLDADIASLYEVPTKALNQAVRRNLDRFPADFMFRLTAEEVASLRSQDVTSSHGGRRYLPYAFTEHGVAMLSAVLKSERALEMSISIIRTFVRLRSMISATEQIASRVARLEEGELRTASVIEVVADDIQMLPSEMEAMRALPEPPARRIGFPA